MRGDGSSGGGKGGGPVRRCRGSSGWCGLGGEAERQKGEPAGVSMSRKRAPGRAIPWGWPHSREGRPPVRWWQGFMAPGFSGSVLARGRTRSPWDGAGASPPEKWPDGAIEKQGRRKSINRRGRSRSPSRLRSRSSRQKWIGRIMRGVPKNSSVRTEERGLGPSIRQVSQTGRPRGGSAGTERVGEGTFFVEPVKCGIGRRRARGDVGTEARKGGAIPGADSGGSSWWHSRTGPGPASPWRQKRSE